MAAKKDIPAWWEAFQTAYQQAFRFNLLLTSADGELVSGEFQESECTCRGQPFPC